MQSLGHALPTYWISDLGGWALYGGDLPLTGLAVIGLLVVAALG
jgi:ABC-2 type transport system permease protein